MCVCNAIAHMTEWNSPESLYLLFVDNTLHPSPPVYKLKIRGECPFTNLATLMVLAALNVIKFHL